MKITPLRCPNCGAKLQLKKNKLRVGEMAHCEHCGNDFVLEEEYVPRVQGQRQAYAAQQNAGRAVAWVVVVMVVLMLVPLLLGLLRSAPSMPFAPAAARTAPVSAAVKGFVSEVFGKPAADVTAADMAAIRYLDIRVTDYYTPDSYAPWREDGSAAWAFTYSFEDYYAGAAGFEASAETVFMPKANNDSIDWEDLQCFTGLTWLETNRCSDIHGSGRDVSLAGLQELKHFGSGFNQDVAAMAELLADPSQIRSLSIGLRTQRDVDALAQFTNLESLTVHYIFSDGIDNINAISVLTKLKTLEVRGGADISWLSTLPSLTAVTIASTSVTDYSVLYGMPNLESLAISLAYDLKDIGFVKSMPRLSRFELEVSDIISLEPLRGCVSLLSLRLEKNRSLQNAEALASLTSLQELSLDSGVGVFPSLSALQYLRTVRLPVQHLDAVKGIAAVTELHVRDSWAIDSLDCAAVAAFPALETLLLENFDRLDNISALRNAEGLTTLRMFDVSLSDADRFSAVFNLPQLEILEMTDCMFEIDTSMLRPSPALRRLSMVDCDFWRFCDGAAILQERAGAALLTPVLGEMTQLEVLELTSAMLEDISFAGTMTALRGLNIADNYVNDVAALSALPALEWLHCVQNPVQNLAILPQTVRVCH